MRRGYSDRACGEPDRTRAGRPTRGRRRAEAWRRPREAAPRPWPRAGLPHRQRLPDRPTRSTTGHPATSPSRGRRRDPGTPSRTIRSRHRAGGLRQTPRRRVPPTTRACAGAAACQHATTPSGSAHHLSGRGRDLLRGKLHPVGQPPVRAGKPGPCRWAPRSGAAPRGAAPEPGAYSARCRILWRSILRSSTTKSRTVFVSPSFW